MLFFMTANLNNCCGEKLITIGTAIAFQIANSLDPDDTSILGELLTVVGDQLSLLSTTKSINNNSSNTLNCSNPTNT